MKLLEALKIMATNSSKITNVLKNKDGETFFKYDNKYTWSLLRNADGNLWMYYYPNSTPDDLIQVDEWENVPMKSYNLRDLFQDDADKIFNMLYGILDQKLYDIDSVLDDIISNK